KAIRINYVLALFFGLIHGLAFANTLRMILASDQSFALAMFSFSLGLESGQILVVSLLLLLSQFFIGLLKVERKHWVIFVSAAVFSLAMEMALQRWPAKETTAWQQSKQVRSSPFFAAFLFENRLHRPAEAAVATLRSTTEHLSTLHFETDKRYQTNT
ncbi:MAG TPA: HupE/UreJ family protein, partial [Flavisolibacter sp.]|nr:HupE/UreJ family protein [Flavisolibacter sp.]